MRKLKLRVEELQVSSFEAAAEEPARPGTVRGHQTGETQCDVATCNKLCSFGCDTWWDPTCEGPTCNAPGCVGTTL